MKRILGHGDDLLWVLVAVLDAVASTHAFRTAAVVGQKQDERVVVLARILERLHHAAHALIHVVDHGGVSLHQANFPFLILGIGPWGGLGVARCHFPLGIDKTHLELPRMARLAQGVPALVVLALVPGNVLGQRVHGPVGSGVGDVDEEGIVALVLLDVARGVVADGVGIIKLVGLVFLVREWRDLRVFARERVGIKEAASAMDGAVKAVKAALTRPVVLGAIRANMRCHVPFAGHVGGVIGSF